MDERTGIAQNWGKVAIALAAVVGLQLALAAPLLAQTDSAVRAGSASSENETSEVAGRATNRAASGVAEAAETGGFWAIVFSGGWVGVAIVLTLLLLSLLAAYLILEQVFTLRRDEVMPAGLADDVRLL